LLPEKLLAHGGRPLWPGVLYLVVSVLAGHAAAARGYRWSEPDQAFAGFPVALLDVV
jgi:hypothetical protein